ncbi:MAG: ABC transporter ATP-binding protein [Bacteroidota bacterium]|nr:ABC transporter ATP-binding protein [Bacteroidota bacterium]
MLKDSKKINNILNQKQKKRLFVLFFMLLIGMIFEVLGVGLLIHIITSIINPEKIMGYKLIKDLILFLNIKSEVEFVKYSLLLLIIVYFIKSIYLLFLSYYQNNFISKLTVDTSDFLFKNYLNKTYIYHLNRNSSELIKNFQVEINGFGNYLVSYLQLLTESVLALSVILTLLYIEFTATIFVLFFFFILSYFFHQFAKKKSERWGSLRALNDTEISKVIIEGLAGIKEILILGRKSFFQRKLIHLNQIKADLSVKSMTIRQVPRFYLELLSVISLVVFIYFLLKNNQNLDRIMITLGVFVGATFRLLPSINRILSSLQNIKYYKSSLEIISNELVGVSKNLNEKETLGGEIDFKKCLELKNISFSYKKNKPILENIDLKINKGELIGIIGQSGAGKTTFINILVGLLTQNSGKIFLDEKELSHDKINLWKCKIGYVPQDVYLIDDTIEKNIAFGIDADKINSKNIEKAIVQSQLKTFINQLPKGINTIVGERGVQISGGQRQRIGIARALYNDAELLVLDEATSALDLETESEFINSVLSLKRDKTILIITHRLSTITNCDKIFKIENGHLKQTKNIYAE